MCALPNNSIRGRRRRTLFAAAAVVGIGVLQAPGATGSSSQPAGKALDAIIAELGSPDFAVRTDATARLSEEPSATLTSLEHVLARRDLSPEQRRRVLSVAQQRFNSSPRGALGVQFGGTLMQSRIVIGQTFEQFPSHKQLQVGDMIVEAAGERIRGDLARATLRSLIIARDPGDVLPVVIRRGAEKLHLDLQLGQFSNLPGSTGLDPFELARAWHVRIADRLAPDKRVIDPGVAASDWPLESEALDLRRKAQLSRAYGQQDEPRLAMGGQPRVGEQAAIQERWAVSRRAQNPLSLLSRANHMLTHEQELDQLKVREKSLDAAIERFSQNDPNGDPRQRQMVEQNLKALKEQLRILQLERAAVTAEAAEQSDAPEKQPGPNARADAEGDKDAPDH